MELQRDGGKLSGRYRYGATSREDLRLEGSIAEATHTFELVETDGKGAVTGRFIGTFDSKSEVTGTWVSADGKKRTPFSLSLANAYPPIVVLASGVRLIPQERHQEPVPGCAADTIFPVFDGLPKPKAARALEKALKRRLEVDKAFTAGDCAGGDPAMPNARDSSYAVLGARPGLVSLELTYYWHTGGAHGNFARSCLVADLEKGALFELGPQLRAGAFEQLSTLARAAFLAEHKVAKLSEAGFFDDSLKVSKDTALCFRESDGAAVLEVVFQPYEIGPWAMGAPRATVPAAVARGLFKPETRGEMLFR